MKEYNLLLAFTRVKWNIYNPEGICYHAAVHLTTTQNLTSKNQILLRCSFFYFLEENCNRHK